MYAEKIEEILNDLENILKSLVNIIEHNKMKEVI